MESWGPVVLSTKTVVHIKNFIKLVVLIVVVSRKWADNYNSKTMQ